MAKWCQGVWANKEEVLRQYYSVSDPSKRRFQSKHRPPFHPRSVALWASLIIWVFFCVLSLWLLVQSPLARWYALMICLFYVTVTLAIGEFTKLEMFFYEMLKKPRKLWGVKSDGENDELSRVYEKYLKSR